MIFWRLACCVFGHVWRNADLICVRCWSIREATRLDGWGYPEQTLEERARKPGHP